MLIGSTWPPAISRSDASPEADTTSYWPVFIRLTASSEVPNVLTVTWQPVAFSNGVTQSTFGSLLPSSAYPGQASTLTLPSPAPSLSILGRSGAVNPVVPAAPWSPESPEVPHAAATTARADNPTTAVSLGTVLMGTPCTLGLHAPRPAG